MSGTVPLCFPNRSLYNCAMHFTCVIDEMKSLFCHLHPDGATFQLVRRPIPPLVFLAAVVDRATPSAETTFLNLHSTSSQFTGRACYCGRCSTCNCTITHHLSDKIFHLTYHGQSEDPSLPRLTQILIPISYLDTKFGLFNRKERKKECCLHYTLSS